jgi:outer membrane protein TolC
VRRLFSGVALLALAGCGVPPHVAQKPVIDNPATQGAFREGDALQQTGAVSRDDLPARWWHLYDDPVLDTLEEQALAANIDLRVAQASLTRARAVSAAAEGQREPDFAASFGVQRARLSGDPICWKSRSRWRRWARPRPPCPIRSTCSGASSTASKPPAPMKRPPRQRLAR